MSLLREIIGFFFIILAWSGPFGMGVEFQILFFILGFDFMSLIPKIVVFALDFLLGLSGIGIFMLAIIVIEAAMQLLALKPIIGYILKPLAVFMILYVNGIAIAIAFIVAGVDLLLNMSKKYI
jgi:hypothetical protein